MTDVEADALPVTPAVIRWARTRAGFSMGEATKHFKRIAAWEEGNASPSYSQLEQMAEKFKCPVATFFFPEPPTLPGVETSFRTLSLEIFEEIPRTIKAFMRKAQAMQLNVSELNDGRNPAPRLITRDLRFAADAPVRDIAGAVRAYLGVSLEQQQEWSSAEDALEQWRDVFASVGVFVFKDAFHTEGYFGFCLYDDEFPVIYVNNTSAKTRQAFTLFHELGHLLFQTSGIDFADDGYIRRLAGPAHQIEVLCNKLASQVLLPDGEFDRAAVGKPWDRETASLLADQYHVSREFIYRRMLDRGWVSADEYRAAATLWASQVKAKSGGDYYYNQISYLGRRYIDLAFQRYYQRRFGKEELAEYLNIKPKFLPAFELKYGGG
jgi:Zn-dependent peptidase ImmA (M78 family)/transcriptional regulator with XRE-family HTH domain